MRIDKHRSRKIFNNPKPPGKIWETQFDYFDDELRAIAKKPWQNIKDKDLWYYLHDLAYVELQKDLFEYLFPICLNFWYETLMRNEDASRGDSEFHYALYQGNILDKMVDKNQQKAIYDYFHDGIIDRIEAERGLIYTGSSTPAYSWMQRFNSIGLIAPIIERIWETWWKLDHPGKAVSAIMYASGLIYLEGENPIFGKWTGESGGGGPYLAESDAGIYDAGWLRQNVDYMSQKLTVEYVQERIRTAADLLKNEPEGKIANKIAEDSLTKGDIMQNQIVDLLDEFSKP